MSLRLELAAELKQEDWIQYPSCIVNTEHKVGYRHTRDIHTD